MKDNEKSIGNTSEKGKSVNLAEIFFFWKYPLLQAMQNFYNQKKNIETVRIFQFTDLKRDIQKLKI